MWNAWNVLMIEDAKQEKDRSCIYIVADDQIAISAKLLHITHEPYGFSANLIETINQ